MPEPPDDEEVEVEVVGTAAVEVVEVCVGLVYDVEVVGVEDLTIDPLPPSLTRFPLG